MDIKLQRQLIDAYSRITDLKSLHTFHLDMTTKADAADRLWAKRGRKNTDKLRNKTHTYREWAYRAYKHIASLEAKGIFLAKVAEEPTS